MNAVQECVLITRAREEVGATMQGWSEVFFVSVSAVFLTHLYCILHSSDSYSECLAREEEEGEAEEKTLLQGWQTERVKMSTIQREREGAETIPEAEVRGQERRVQAARGRSRERGE